MDSHPPLSDCEVYDGSGDGVHPTPWPDRGVCVDWSKIHIKYIENLYDLVKLASVLPLAERPPRALIIHGLDVMMDASVKILPSLMSAHGGQRALSVEWLLCRALSCMTDAMVSCVSCVVVHTHLHDELLLLLLFRPC